MSDQVKKYFCPRLLDYVIIVGPEEQHWSFGRDEKPCDDTYSSRVPHLIRRFPPDDHEDFSLPPDVVIFCQPEGCTRLKCEANAYNNPTRTNNSFVFLLTEKDTSRIRYGACLNFYRPVQRAAAASGQLQAAASFRSASWLRGQQKQQQQQLNGALSTGRHRSRSRTITANEQFELKENLLLREILAGSSLQQQQQQQDEAQSQQSWSCESGIRISTTTPPNDSFESRALSEMQEQQQQQARAHQSSPPPPPPPPPPLPRRNKRAKLTYALTSICIISHHAFFSAFREILFVIKKFLEACDERQLEAAYAAQHLWTQCECLVGLTGRGPQNLVRNHALQCAYSTPVWSLLTRANFPDHLMPRRSLADLVEFESWTLRLLSVPAPLPGKTRIELDLMPVGALRPALLFALPDHTRLSLADFPLHLPLELLGVRTCLQVLTCILLEHKVAIQSKDYNALSMSIMAFIAMIYPLEYMFPVIPLLPSYMSSAEQLLLAPTPFIIGLPSSFFKLRRSFALPNDVWLVDLDANKVHKPAAAEELPALPVVEGSLLAENLDQILESMSSTFEQNATRASSNQDNQNKERQQASALKLQRPSNRSSGSQLIQLAASKFGISGSQASLTSEQAKITIVESQPTKANCKREKPTSSKQAVSKFDPRAMLMKSAQSCNGRLAVDLDAVDVAVRIALVQFFNSHQVLGNFVEHTRTIRLYPRPVVSFQKSSFLQWHSGSSSQFLFKLVETQSVEYLAEWMISPDNVAFQRIQMGLWEPEIIGDKPKWFAAQQSAELELLRYQVNDGENEDFYQEIAQLIKRPGSALAASSCGPGNANRFSHYLDFGFSGGGGSSSSSPSSWARQFNQEEERADENNNISCLLSGEKSPSPPSFQEFVRQQQQQKCFKIVSLDQELRARRESTSSEEAESSLSSSDSNWSSSSSDQNDHHYEHNGDEAAHEWTRCQRKQRKTKISEQLIPANYQHETKQLPALRCNWQRCFRPCNRLIGSLSEARKWNKAQESREAAAAATLSVQYRDGSPPVDDSYDSLGHIVAPDSSSCDESRTEEFNFECFSSVSLATSGAQQLSSAIVSPVDMLAASCDESSLYRRESSIDSEPPIEHHQETYNVSSEAHERPIETNAGPLVFGAHSLLGEHKSRLTASVARLMERASSSSLGLTSGAAGDDDDDGGEPVGSLIGRFKSELSGAMRDALDAGKAALKTASNQGDSSNRKRLISGTQRSFGDEQRGKQTCSSSTSWLATTEQARQRSPLSVRSIGHLSRFSYAASSCETPPSNDSKQHELGDEDDTIVALNPQLFTRPNCTKISINLSNSNAHSKVAERASSIPKARPKLRLINIRSSALNKTIDRYERINRSSSTCLSILPPFLSGQKLVQKSHLIRHSSQCFEEEARQREATTQRGGGGGGGAAHTAGRSQHCDSENRNFLKEATSAMMRGDSLGWLKLNRLRRLMEEESYRDLVLVQINANSQAKLRPDERLGQVALSRPVWRSVLKVCLALVTGLEQSYQHNKCAGMASAFSLLELAHTHYFVRPERPSNSHKRAPNNDQLCQEDNDDYICASTSGGRGSPQQTSHNNNSNHHQQQRLEMLDYGRASSSLGLARRGELSSSSSTSSSSHNWTRASQRSRSSCGPKLDNGFALEVTPDASSKQTSVGSACERVFLYEALVKRDQRSSLWDQMQFWEEAFLDVVSHERCLVGMDQGPEEMLERYKLLLEIDRKRLEHEEDKLLSVLLYNMVGFMLMLQVDQQMIKQKIRRLLGKCHIGLVNSAEINRLLERIDSLSGNQIELKPMASRQQSKQTFALHRATEPRGGDIVLMEVSDEGLIIRAPDGSVSERWWYERLINMTYSPRNEIVCFWLKSNGRTVLNKFYTRKCRQLYNSIKESMQNAATQRGSARLCSELGGEFPILDLRSGEGGILQVCMQGVGLMFSTNRANTLCAQYFIRLENIRKCFTKEGGTFVLEEYNPKTRKLVENNFKSQMADQICYAVLCVFSYVAAGRSSGRDSSATSTADEQCGSQKEVGDSLG